MILKEHKRVRFYIIPYAKLRKESHPTPEPQLIDLCGLLFWKPAKK